MGQYMNCCTQQTEEYEVNNLSANSQTSARGGYNSSGVSPNDKSGGNSIVARPTSSVANNKDINNTTMEFGGAQAIAGGSDMTKMSS